MLIGTSSCWRKKIKSSNIKEASYLDLGPTVKIWAQRLINMEIPVLMRWMKSCSIELGWHGYWRLLMRCPKYCLQPEVTIGEPFINPWCPFVENVKPVTVKTGWSFLPPKTLGRHPTKRVNSSMSADDAEQIAWKRRRKRRNFHLTWTREQTDGDGRK